jgi:hypothetical protein
MSKSNNPDYNSLIQKGKNSRWKNKMEKSIMIFSKAIELDPKHWEGLILLNFKLTTKGIN